MAHKRRRAYSNKDPMGMHEAYKLMGTAVQTTAGIYVANAAIGAVKALKP